MQNNSELFIFGWNVIGTTLYINKIVLIIAQPAVVL